MSLRRLTLVLLVAAARPAHALLLGGVLRPSTLPTGAITLTRCAPVKAQLAPAPTKTRQKTYTNDGGGGKGGGGAPSAAIAKPKRKAHTEEVPLYKVILLGDSEYEEDPVRQHNPHCSLTQPALLTHSARTAHSAACC